jgi:uncharacterized protein (TIGR02117 family)
MRTQFQTFVAILLLCCASGCSLARSATAFVFPQETAPFENEIALASHEELSEGAETAQDRSIEIFVVGHGWHTGLVIPTSQVENNQFPELAEFSAADFVEIGWGDEGFYRAKKISPGLVAKAAFWPTPSVMHVAGFRGDVEEMFPHSDIVSLRLPRSDFEFLVEFVSNTFDQSDTDDLGPGLYGDSRFFRAKGNYYFPKTCNVWTAKALKHAGLEMRTYTSMTAESVLKQARSTGTDQQRSATWAKRSALGLEPK